MLLRDPVGVKIFSGMLRIGSDVENSSFRAI
jgi:hypothetical protein